MERSSLAVSKKMDLSTEQRSYVKVNQSKSETFSINKIVLIYCVFEYDHKVIGILVVQVIYCGFGVLS